jgi:hypothetical protein
VLTGSRAWRSTESEEEQTRAQSFAIEYKWAVLIGLREVTGCRTADPFGCSFHIVHGALIPEWNRIIIDAPP